MRDLAGIVERIHVLEYTKPYGFRKQIKALQTEYKNAFNNRNKGKQTAPPVTGVHHWPPYDPNEYNASQTAPNDLNIWK